MQSSRRTPDQSGAAQGFGIPESHPLVVQPVTASTYFLIGRAACPFRLLSRGRSARGLLPGRAE